MINPLNVWAPDTWIDHEPMAYYADFQAYLRYGTGPFASVNPSGSIVPIGWTAEMMQRFYEGSWCRVGITVGEPPRLPWRRRLVRWLDGLRFRLSDWIAP